MDDGHKRHNPEWFEWYDAAVFGLAVIVLCFTFVVRIVTVDGHSMEPTLSSGQRVAVQAHSTARSAAMWWWWILTPVTAICW